MEEVVVSDFMDKAKQAGEDSADKVTGSEPVTKAEDMAQDKAAEGGPLGTAADKADDAIDKAQGTQD
jgi:hypothetical protein